MRKQRKHYTAEEKVAVLRRHLIDNEPVSKLCDQLVLQPTVFSRISILTLVRRQYTPTLPEYHVFPR